MQKQVSKSKLLKKTTRDFNALAELLDGPIIKTANGPLLTKAKPFTPTQQRRLLKKTFKTILDTLHYCKLELDLRSQTASEYYQRTANKDTGNINVISHKPIVARRRAEILARERDLVSNMFKEVLEIYERLEKHKYQPQGTVK